MVKILVQSEAGPLDGLLDLEKEAQIAAARQHVWEGDITLDVLSSDSVDTTARHDLHAIPRLDFGSLGGETARSHRRHEILAAATGTPNVLSFKDPAWQVIQTVADGDIVMLAGGTISSRSPGYVYECATLLGLAILFSKPLFIGAISVGPLLDGPERELVAEILKSAVIIGARDSATFDLMTDLGIDPDRFRRTVDDTAFLGMNVAASIRSDDGYVLAAFSSETGAIPPESFAQSVAALLDHVALRTKLRVILPNFTDPSGMGVTSADDAIRKAILAHTTSGRVESMDTPTVTASAVLARDADLVIASSLQFATFAAAAGVPTVGIATDLLLQRQISNLLTDFGQHGAVVPAGDLGTRDATRTVDQVWKRRATIRTEGSRAVEIRRSEKESWWRQPLLRLGGVVWGGYEFATIDQSDAARSSNPTDSAAADSIVARALSEKVIELEQALDSAQAAITELGQLRIRVAELDDENQRVTERSAEFEAELRATLATKTFRYSEQLRKAYTRLRR